MPSFNDFIGGSTQSSSGNSNGGSTQSSPSTAPSGSAELITNNLNDTRMLGVKLFLEGLIERTKHGGGIEQYRIKDQDGNDITSITDFTSGLDDDYILIKPNNNLGQQTLGTTVTYYITNYTVSLSRYSEEDSVYSIIAGVDVRTIYLVAGYIGDNDTTLPIKLLSVGLI